MIPRVLIRLIWSVISMGLATDSLQASGIPIPSIYTDSIDLTRSSDQPIFQVTAGPGGNGLDFAHPSRIRFSGYAQNLHPQHLIGVEVYVLAKTQNIPYEDFLYYQFPTIDLPPTLESATTNPTVPIEFTSNRVPIEFDLVLPYSAPDVTLQFGGTTYASPPGIRVAGTLTYAVGVPEPSAIAALISCAISVSLMIWRQRMSKQRVRSRS